jgi:hypothetical protein
MNITATLITAAKNLFIVVLVGFSVHCIDVASLPQTTHLPPKPSATSDSLDPYRSKRDARRSILVTS